MSPIKKKVKSQPTVGKVIQEPVFDHYQERSVGISISITMRSYVTSWSRWFEVNTEACVTSVLLHGIDHPHTGAHTTLLQLCNDTLKHSPYNPDLMIENYSHWITQPSNHFTMNTVSDWPLQFYVHLNTLGMQPFTVKPWFSPLELSFIATTQKCFKRLLFWQEPWNGDGAQKVCCLAENIYLWPQWEPR